MSWIMRRLMTNLPRTTGLGGSELKFQIQKSTASLLLQPEGSCCWNKKSSHCCCQFPSSSPLLNSLTNHSSKYGPADYHRSYQSTVQPSSQHGRSNGRRTAGTGISLGGLMLALSMPWSKKTEDTDLPKDPVLLTLKRAVLASKKGNSSESQELFHTALKLAHEQLRRKEVNDQQYLIIQINIFTLMAEAAMKAGDLDNAEKLYKESMKKCLESGQKKDDDSIIELSVKLATVYATQSRDDEAELGFKYCMDTMNEKVKKCGGILEADTNTLALQGLSIQSYARLCMKMKQFKKGIELYNQSLEIAKEVYGANHPQCLVVLNDLASAYVISRQYKEGIDKYREACFRAEQMDDMENSLVAFYYNLGETQILTKDFDNAEKACAQCLEFAKKTGVENLIKVAHQCAKDVKEVRAKGENNSSKS